MDATRKSLLRRARDPRDHRAWEEFFDQYAGPVRGYARKLGLPAADADDVLQETMVELMRILPDFRYDRDRGRFRNFVFTIAHRRAQAAWRRQRTRREIPLDSEGAREAAAETGPNDPGEEALRAWREELLREAMRRLDAEPGRSAATREIFRAHVIERRSAAEVARRFGVTPNHVYQIKHRLLNRLRKTVALLVEEIGEFK